MIRLSSNVLYVSHLTQDEQKSLLDQELWVTCDISYNGCNWDCIYVFTANRETCEATAKHYDPLPIGSGHIIAVARVLPGSFNGFNIQETSLAELEREFDMRDTTHILNAMYSASRTRAMHELYKRLNFRPTLMKKGL